ncbi:class I SAM-dependent methyltransferase [Solibacillus sp. CAU 1738]|uniref:class I SAM-dependent methyltransferase n=1 Tax=Solibacillus sp. CAU 1738 TaxID=3140363 RepID=UPI00325FEC1C
MNEFITSSEDVLNMLDDLLRDPTEFWNEFYKDRTKEIPFFINAPDENLVSYFTKNIVQAGRVLELGCGAGRNAIYLAQQGCSVDAVDLSETALFWARERAAEKKLNIQFIHGNLFNMDFPENNYDFIYDSGCFHHIAPHRRLHYVEIVQRALKPGGHFALNCFAENGVYGGAALSDWDVYRNRSLQGGLGYTKEKLQSIFKDFQEIEIREMQPIEKPNALFELEGFIVSIFRKG